MATLKAQKYILFENKTYSPGDTLPAHNQGMVKAWISAGTAVLIEDETTQTKAKAQPKIAEPGLPGVAVASESEDGENLVGKVPKTTSRKKK